MSPRCLIKVRPAGRAIHGPSTLVLPGPRTTSGDLIPEDGGLTSRSSRPGDGPRAQCPGTHATGAAILADTRRLADCFPSVDYFEKHQLPFVVAINRFDGALHFDPEDVRIALDLGARVPVMLCDARQPGSAKQVLITLVEHLLASRPAGNSARSPAPVPGPGDGARPATGSAGLMSQDHSHGR